jgi:hypothetical protein
MSHVLLTLLCVLISAVTGCALTGGPPPSPLVGTPLPESPEEFVLTRPKWKPGAKVRVKYEVWAKIEQGGRTLLQQAEQGTHTFKGIDRTARGLTRVEYSLNEKILGFALMTDDGMVEDIVLADATFSKDTRDALEDTFNPGFWKQAPIRLTRGKKTDIDMPGLASFKGMPPAWRSSLRETVVVGLEYMGIVDFQGVRAAVVRGEYRNLLASPVYDGRMRCGRVDIEILTFFDPTTAVTLAEYQTTTPEIFLDGMPAIMRLVHKAVLDRESTVGF